ncbi:hypothetical protein [Dyadobacter alkalitolerans]|nr:hypothetical protein [Dyadobacter alkalitolerans]
MYDTLGRQVQWIKKDLAANQNKDWIVASWHHPPYSQEFMISSLLRK